MEGMGTSSTQKKDRQWFLKINLSVYTLTVGMHSVSLQTSGHGGGRGLVPNKAGSMDHRCGGDIQGGSIAISG